MAAETDKRSVNAAPAGGSEPGPSNSVKEASPSNLTNGVNIEEKITEFQKNASTIIAPGVKRKAVNIEKPNIGVLFSSDEINYLVYRYLLENGML